jgi:hypothetical protein
MRKETRWRKSNFAKNQDFSEILLRKYRAEQDWDGHVYFSVAKSH